MISNNVSPQVRFGGTYQIKLYDPQGTKYQKAAQLLEELKYKGEAHDGCFISKNAALTTPLMQTLFKTLVDQAIETQDRYLPNDTNATLVYAPSNQASYLDRFYLLTDNTDFLGEDQHQASNLDAALKAGKPASDAIEEQLRILPDGFMLSDDKTAPWKFRLTRNPFQSFDL